jgi:hypothetical protein
MNGEGHRGSVGKSRYAPDKIPRAIAWSVCKFLRARACLQSEGLHVRSRAVEAASGASNDTPGQDALSSRNSEGVVVAHTLLGAHDDSFRVAHEPRLSPVVSSLRSSTDRLLTTTPSA